ncbi:unnamed protein product, partial [Effrenium voratum]
LSGEFVQSATATASAMAILFEQNTFLEVRFPKLDQQLQRSQSWSAGDFPKDAQHLMIVSDAELPPLPALLPLGETGYTLTKSVSEVAFSSTESTGSTSTPADDLTLHSSQSWSDEHFGKDARNLMILSDAELSSLPASLSDETGQMLTSFVSEVPFSSTDSTGTTRTDDATVHSSGARSASCNPCLFFASHRGCQAEVCGFCHTHESLPGKRPRKNTRDKYKILLQQMMGAEPHVKHAELQALAAKNNYLRSLIMGMLD